MPEKKVSSMKIMMDGKPVSATRYVKHLTDSGQAVPHGVAEAAAREQREELVDEAGTFVGGPNKGKDGVQLPPVEKKAPAKKKKASKKKG